MNEVVLIVDYLRRFFFIIIDMNECISTPCQHSAVCSDVVNGFLCACQSGYTGVLCETGQCLVK